MVKAEVLQLGEPRVGGLNPGRRKSINCVSRFSAYIFGRAFVKWSCLLGLIVFLFLAQPELVPQAC